MLQTDKKRNFKGMTLVEVIVAMTIIILVTIIAYIGVNTSANLTQHGIDLRNSDGPLVSQLEVNIKSYYNKGAEVTKVIGYAVRMDEKVTDIAGEVVGKETGTEVTKYEYVGVVSAANDMVEYDMYLPYVVTTVPEDEGH